MRRNPARIAEVRANVRENLGWYVPSPPKKGGETTDEPTEDDVVVGQPGVRTPGIGDPPTDKGDKYST